MIIKINKKTRLNILTSSSAHYAYAHYIQTDTMSLTPGYDLDVERVLHLLRTKPQLLYICTTEAITLSSYTVPNYILKTYEDIFSTALSVTTMCAKVPKYLVYIFKYDTEYIFIYIMSSNDN